MTQRIRVADEKLGILLRREQDLNRRVLEGALDINKVLAELQEIIEGKLKNILCISANLSLSDRIALGKYDSVSDDIAEKNFPDKTEKDYKVEYRIFHFNRPISSESAITEMEKEGFRVASILELLRLGEIKPELQREFPIVALVSVERNNNDNRRVVPVLDCVHHERKLNLNWFGSDWLSNVRFLGVRQAA